VAELGAYVYGVVSGAAALSDLRGVGAVHDGALAAVISRVALADFDEAPLSERLGDPEWLERAVRAHEEVLDAVRARATVIPMRLLSIYRSEASVRDFLAGQARYLEATLARLEGKTEWGVKVFADLDCVERLVAEDEVGLAGGAAGAGAAYMQARIRARQAGERAERLVGEASMRIHERLWSLAAEALVSPPQRPAASGHAGEMILNGVYLVEDDRQRGFHDDVHSLQSEYAGLGLELEPTGPWPAYNFVPDTIGAAE
jgi:hypothetical protein